MRCRFGIPAAVLPCIVLSACATTFYGNESSSGGSTTTATSATVAASASSSNARISFAYGPRIPANAPGGHLTLSSNSGASLGVAVIFGVLASYIVGEEGPKPLPAGTRLLQTCSCYGYQPPVGEKRPVNRE